tara:strand:+ start:267 stop:605 length:339 start_codon:yes stop_codon:yes gene_type:complete
MTTDIPEEIRDSTTSAIYYIESSKNISRLVHDMLHACETVEDYMERLNGLLRIFWGDVTPEGKNMDEVAWIDVVVSIFPTDCLIPIFKNSMLDLEGREREDEGKTHENPNDR